MMVDNIMTEERKNVRIHPTAIVEDGAKIGEGTSIWHHAHVRSDSILGKNCILGKDVYIDAGVKIGNGVNIGNGVKIDEGVNIGSRVDIGEGVEIGNDVNISDEVNIGDNTTLTVGYTLVTLIGVSLGVYPDDAGNYILYKKVNKIENKYFSCYDDNFEYKIGALAVAHKVNEDINVGCGTGLHVSTANYWQSGNTLLQVKVNISDIVTCKGGKLRVRQLTVLREIV